MRIKRKQNCDFRIINWLSLTIDLVLLRWDFLQNFEVNRCLPKKIKWMNGSMNEEKYFQFSKWAQSNTNTYTMHTNSFGQQKQISEWKRQTRARWKYEQQSEEIIDKPLWTLNDEMTTYLAKILFHVCATPHQSTISSHICVKNDEIRMCLSLCMRTKFHVSWIEEWF